MEGALHVVPSDAGLIRPHLRARLRGNSKQLQPDCQIEDIVNPLVAAAMGNNLSIA